MPTPVLKDSKKTDVKVRQLRERSEVWGKKFEDMENVISQELKKYLEKMNGDLPTYLDLKREIFPVLYQYGQSTLSERYASWLYFTGKGYNPNFQIVNEVFIAPK